MTVYHSESRVLGRVSDLGLSKNQFLLHILSDQYLYPVSQFGIFSSPVNLSLCVTVTVAGNRFDDQSSNPRIMVFIFHFVLILLGNWKFATLCTRSKL